MSRQNILPENIFPDNVEYVIKRIEETNSDMLLPEEQDYCARFGKKRRMEYIVGRSCVRGLFNKLGLRTSPLLTGSHGEPLWPEGITGSISHCDEYCFVAVSEQKHLLSLGIDIEPYDFLSQDVEELICTQFERKWIRSIGKSDQTIPWSKIIFSAKESAYKCIFPLEKKFIDFHDAEIEITQRKSTFKIDVVNKTEKSFFCPTFQLMKGYCFVNGKIIVTIVYINNANSRGH